MSDTFREFITFAPNTTAGDWAWVTLSWLLSFLFLGGYQLYLMARRRRLSKEQEQ